MCEVHEYVRTEAPKIKCKICDRFQMRIPDYRCKRCAREMAYDALILPFEVRSRRHIESYDYPTYARPQWRTRLGQKPPSISQIKELRHATQLEF